MKFKVGDKVVVSPKANPLLGGLSGIVVETQESPIADTAYYKVDLDEERVFPERHLIAETEYRFLTGLNATAHQILATCGIKAADSDTKVLRAKDGTIIGEFGTGDTLPTNEWFKLVFKNGSSIEVMPNEDAIRSKEEKKMPTKFTFYVTEGTRVDKSCNGTIPTMTTTVINGLDEVSVTCDKADYNERQGVLEGIAQLYCKGRFDKEYEAAVKLNKRNDKVNRTCVYCRKIFDTAEERVEHEKWHVERKKARRERYLLRKRAKEIAFEEQAQKMAKEMIEK